MSFLKAFVLMNHSKDVPTSHEESARQEKEQKLTPDMITSMIAKSFYITYNVNISAWALLILIISRCENAYIIS